MKNSREQNINKLLEFYKKEWMAYDKDLLIEQCYDLDFKTKKDIKRLNKKTKEEIVELLLAEDVNELFEKKDSEIEKELHQFLIDCI